MAGLRTRAWLLGAAFGAVALVRLYYCTLVPRSTGDLPRHLMYGLYVARDGLQTAGIPLAELGDLGGLAWSELPYNYPVVALYFFTAVAALSPTMFFAKVALTVVDALSASILYKHSGNRTLALLYWASPTAIWWVSGEGQFEPIQAFFIVAAIHVLRRDTRLAFALLALGIQTKLTAAALLPMFALELLRRRRARETAETLGAFALAFAPSAFAQLRYPMVASVATSIASNQYNPYYWNPTERSLFAWNSEWMVGINAIVSYGVLVALLVGAVRSGWDARSQYIAPLCLMVFYKLSPLCQPWYMLTFMPLFLAIENPRLRTALFVVAPLLDVLGALQMIFGPLGFVAAAGYYGDVTAFTKLFIPGR